VIPAPRGSSRKGYLDWLRGAAVVLMIQGHTVDSWTRLSDKSQMVYGWIFMAWGIAAPLFLFLAGVSQALAAGARIRQGRTAAEAAALARRRGWQIFGLAFLFRLQAWLISGGDAYRTLFKVDILNVMGLAMLAGAVLWGLGRGPASRAWLLGGGAALVAMATPLVRAMTGLAWLPEPIEWYFRPFAGGTGFTLLPWAGFLLAGGAVGLAIDSAREPAAERVLNVSLALGGTAVAFCGYVASFLSPIYARTDFWTSSPTFFFIRLGILITLLPIAFAINPRLRYLRSTLQDFGRSSLFVYWIHVEMAYGVISGPLHHRLPLASAITGWVLLTLLLFGLVKLKERLGRLERHHVSHFGNQGAAQHLARALVAPFVVDKEKIAQGTVNEIKPQV
jgi:uncharacterized membrane protein